ncbi:MAG: efflux RND transporter periplasmic adaptor subunit [Planctomycetes bacterium]|nr:efflux RND transporter periplasmic adaptor subunit [Planctomycetota bacterium]
MSDFKIDILKMLGKSSGALVAMIMIFLAFVVGIKFGFWFAPDAKQIVEKSVEYTCSMHPNIRMPNKDDRCPICGMELIEVGSIGDDNPRELVMTATAMKLADIQTTVVERMFPTQTVRLFGTINYDETRIATVAAYFPGRLERLFVDYTGVVVNKGDHLASIYSPDLITAHVELKEALLSVQQGRGSGDLLRSIAQQQLDAAREKLRLWGLTDQQVKGLEQTEKPIERLTIYSPISGVVINKKAVEGKYVKTGEELYKVADLSKLWVELEAYESQLTWIRYAQDVTFTTQSLPGQEFTGTIAFIDPIVNAATRTVRVRVNVDNSKGQLKPGMFVRAVVQSEIAGFGLVVTDELAGKWICPMHPEVISDSEGECDICEMPLVPIEDIGYVPNKEDLIPPLVIPASVPLITGKRAVVYVKVPDREQPTFEGREVVLGPRAGDLYIVVEGLAEGEEVVSYGAFKVDSAMQILAKPSMMSVPKEDIQQEQVAAPEIFLQGLKPVYDAYFLAQEALATDDLEKFQAGARQIHQSLDSVEVKGLKGESLGKYRRIEKSLRTDSEHINHITELEKARSLFETYSKAILDLEEIFGHVGDSTYYQTYCPMAFDDKGATWLAQKSEINNPYFGSMMLRCGEVKNEFAAREIENTKAGEN